MNFINSKINSKNKFVYLDSCPICKCDTYTLKYTFSKTEDIFLKTCNNCKTVYFNKFYNPKMLKNAYQGYNDKFYAKPIIEKKNIFRQLFNFLMQTKLYTPEINDKSKKMIDVGCGNGKKLYEYKSRGHKVLGIDIDMEAIKRLNQNNIPAICIDLLSEDIPKKYNNSADIVLFYFILEHLNNSDILAKLNKLLKKGGNLYITIPNQGSLFEKIFGKYYFVWLFGQHIMFPSKKGIKIIAKQYGFNLKKVRLIPDQMEVTGSFIFLFKKNITSPEIIDLRGSHMNILANVFLAPILRILKIFGLSGNIQFELKKIK